MARGCDRRSSIIESVIILDVETTGLSPLHDSLIEVCALRCGPSGIVDTYSSLVNPQVGLPPEITRLTGITLDQVATAPRFAEIAPELFSFLGDAVLVAHNAVFDYGFLREEFRRIGISYRATTLCVARLARRLLPLLPSAALDRVAAHLEISVAEKHRAAADAHTTYAALLALSDIARDQGVRGLVRLQYQRTGKRDRDLLAQIRQLPKAPGVYLLRDASGHLVYVGKAVNLRRRVQSHFRPGVREPYRLRRVLSNVQTIEHIETGSELEALLLESRLIKQLLPAGNQAQRDYQQYPYLRLSTQDRFPRLDVTRQVQADGATYYGPFRRATLVQSVVEQLQKRLRLPRCTGPIIPGETPLCVYGQMGRCLAPCVGEASEGDYAQAIHTIQDLLSGKTARLIEELEKERDTLAENLEFEEAAALRDAAHELERVFHAQHELSSTIAECHVVILTRARLPGCVALFAIQEGLLRAHREVRPGNDSVTSLETWLDQVYVPEERTAQSFVSNDQLDELHIITSWLRHNVEHFRTVVIDPAHSRNAATSLYRAIEAFDLFTVPTVPAARDDSEAPAASIS
ncbi:MAG: exonuclease domain-containing protein [Chloroflexi bacterium]|nr:exonuclease domain-containing protein [Chloroflexota bacterium]